MDVIHNIIDDLIVYFYFHWCHLLWPLRQIGNAGQLAAFFSYVKLAHAQRVVVIHEVLGNLHDGRVLGDVQFFRGLGVTAHSLDMDAFLGDIKVVPLIDDFAEAVVLKVVIPGGNAGEIRNKLVVVNNRQVVLE
ncbi:hypothetical protein SDC9_195512 [bioreactor metagenome]|uniref:Uncharacterized protein n=1 Tax=bioreactor metagenome TaxID=1076179 RepID=A0A645I9I0_9ZZZZ